MSDNQKLGVNLADVLAEVSHCDDPTYLETGWIDVAANDDSFCQINVFEMCGEASERIQELEKELAESAPKSELLELILSDSNNRHIGERHFELIKSLKSLTNHKE